MAKSKTTHNPRSANGIDHWIGERIRAARNIKKISQAELAAALGDGLSFQQVQKYEKGTNRLSIGRLIEVANALEVPIDWFLEGAPGIAKNNAEDLFGSFFKLPYARDVATDYVAIKHNADRDVVRTVTHALAGK